MLFIGHNAVENLKNMIGANDKVLLFTGKNIYTTFFNEIKSYFNQCQINIFYDFSKNPKYDEIINTTNKYHNQKIDKIIAFGGGSVIDFAKAFKYYSKRNIPLIAIPTTAGTGSEVTQFAVVYKNEKKISIDESSIMPEIAIVDSQFSKKAPQYIKACSAIDAYCQAIESFWAKKATNYSKKIALQAIALCRDNIIKAVNSQEYEANENMSKASNLSGQAINITRTTAAHALSYKMTSKYNIPHGHAVGLCMPGVFEQNIKVIPDANKLLEVMGIKEENISQYFQDLMKNLNLEYDLKKLNIVDIKEIVESVNLERLANNPKALSPEDIFTIFK